MASFIHASLGLALPLWLAGAPPAAPTSLALLGDHLLLGTERGLYRDAPEGWLLVLTRGGVRDLAPAGGVLWIAAGAGLYVWSPRSGEAPQRIGLAGGEVYGVAADAEATVWVAGRGGLFRRPADGGDFARELSLPAGEVTAVRCAGREVWVATGGALWVRRDGSRFERVLHGLEDGWGKLRAAAVAGGETLLAVPSGLWRVGARDARRIELGIGEVHALRVSGGTVHVASERGVYPYPVGSLDSGVVRAALRARAVALARRGSELLVATSQGVAAVPLGAPAAVPMGLRPRGSTSDIGNLQRAVLAYLELSPTRLSRVEARARSSPWLPEVRVSFAVDRDRSYDREHDEVLSSGAVYGLVDADREHDRKLGFDLQLVWDLARDTEPDQALAISRERRQLVELRDSVLERVTRLYFERERVLSRLARLAEGAATEERVELELRERELAAQLDGWSGGLFSRLQSDSPPRRRP